MSLIIQMHLFSSKMYVSDFCVVFPGVSELFFHVFLGAQTQDFSLDKWITCNRSLSMAQQVET